MQRHAPHIGPPAVESAFLLTQAEALLSRVLGRALAPYGVSWPQALSLLVLAEQGGPISATRLVEQLGLGRTAMTSVVDRLERQGWVERRPSPADRRVALLVLTDAGRQMIDEIRPRLGQAIAGYFAGLDPEALAAWRAGLTRLIAVLRATTPASAEP